MSHICASIATNDMSEAVGIEEDDAHTFSLPMLLHERNIITIARKHSDGSAITPARGHTHPGFDDYDFSYNVALK